MQEQV